MEYQDISNIESQVKYFKGEFGYRGGDEKKYYKKCVWFVL